MNGKHGVSKREAIKQGMKSGRKLPKSVCLPDIVHNHRILLKVDWENQIWSVGSTRKVIRFGVCFICFLRLYTPSDCSTVDVSQDSQWKADLKKCEPNLRNLQKRVQKYRKFNLKMEKMKNMIL